MFVYHLGHIFFKTLNLYEFIKIQNTDGTLKGLPVKAKQGLQALRNKTHISRFQRERNDLKINHNPAPRGTV